MLAGSHSQARCFYRIALVVFHGGHEFGKPRNFVPTGFGVDQQRRIAFEHPLQAFQNGRVMRPNFSIGSRELAPIGKRGFHGGIAMALKQSNGKALFGQSIRGGDACNATTDNCNFFHD